MAPPEIADSFQSFLAKLQSSSTSADSPSSNPKGQNPNDSSKGVVDRSTESGSGSSKEGDKEAGWKGPPGKPADFENFWEAPKGLWKAREWSEREIEAIMVSTVNKKRDSQLPDRGCCRRSRGFRTSFLWNLHCC